MDADIIKEVPAWAWAIIVPVIAFAWKILQKMFSYIFSLKEAEMIGLKKDIKTVRSDIDELKEEFNQSKIDNKEVSVHIGHLKLQG